MPELPEVETIVRQLRDKIVGQKIERVDILRASQWKQNDPAAMQRTLPGEKIAAIDRRAKFISIEFGSGNQLVLHLRMTGKLIWSPGKALVDKFTRTIICFESGASMQFNDTRALGTLAFYPVNERDQWQCHLGIEPLSDDWQVQRLHEMCSQTALQMKDFLLDQTRIAGIGNIYANEILFRAKIHPERRANTLSDREIAALFRIIPQVLQLAVAKMGTSLGDGVFNYRSVYNIEGEFQNILAVYDREGEPCPVCQSPVRRIRQKGRSSYFCERCQS
ncbi:MAG: bifunctional DNA-formamidopyrimidine glycosylase/DNA-(apurinic or apyrimidinic site) lyase [Candidatus Zhuqueibacterota bacterium]